MTVDLSDINVSSIADALIKNSWAKFKCPETALDIPKLGHVWRLFFSNKSWQSFGNGKNLEGYFAPYSETAVGESNPDPKEFFHWFGTQPLPEIQASITDVAFDICVQLSNAILDELYGSSALSTRFGLKANGNHLLRAIRYFPDDNSPACAIHSDITLISFVIWREHPSIGIINKNGKRTQINLFENEIIVFAGDMLEFASNKNIRSQKHFALNEDIESHAIVFFANPSNDTLLGSGVTAGELLIKRLDEMKFNA